MVSLLLAIIYLCFISLGLPDSLLGAAWPSIYPSMGVPLSAMAYISMTISAGTIVSSLLSDTLSRKIGSGLLTAISILLTAMGLLSFYFANQYWMLFLCAIPYGLGAGGVDAVLNNYVALHFKSRHMSWLHAMWGIGASISPNIMAIALNGGNWHNGYLFVFFIQIAISSIAFASLPLWKKNQQKEEAVQGKKEESKHLGVFGVLKIPGAALVFLAFFCYCACESIVFSWSASYFVLQKGVLEDEAASLASMCYIGMTLSRLLNGFLTMKFKDRTLIRVGACVVILGGVLLAIPGGKVLAIIAFLMIGLGCGPIYPSVVHSTPELFGKASSQAMIGVQMAFAYLANLSMPPLFGNLAQAVGIWILPFFLLIMIVLMFVLYEIVLRLRKGKEETIVLPK